MNQQPLISRRTVLVGAASAWLVACGSDGGDGSADTTAVTSSTRSGSADGAEGTPAETEGPFASNGSNENGAGEVADALHDERIVRSDIRANLDGTEVQPGVPTSVRLALTDASGAAISGAPVYVWHCNREGQYSQYRDELLDDDYTADLFLRGLQVSDEDGALEFQTILPGRYPGRAFHVHLQVYRDGTYEDLLLTSQLGAPDDVVAGWYAAPGYEGALEAVTDNDEDGVFFDSIEGQSMTVDGDVASGLTLSHTIVIG